MAASSNVTQKKRLKAVLVRMSKAPHCLYARQSAALLRDDGNLTLPGVKSNRPYCARECMSSAAKRGPMSEEQPTSAEHEILRFADEIDQELAELRAAV
jgi:hypothetical protein